MCQGAEVGQAGGARAEGVLAVGVCSRLPPAARAVPLTSEGREQDDRRNKRSRPTGLRDPRTDSWDGGQPVAPPGVGVASLPFASEIVFPTAGHMAGLNLGGRNRPYGFKASFNRTFRVDDGPTGWWVTPYQVGIDQGPVMLMIENYRTGLVWDIARRCPYVVAGLRRAGFRGG